MHNKSSAGGIPPTSDSLTGPTPASLPSPPRWPLTWRDLSLPYDRRELILESSLIDEHLGLNALPIEAALGHGQSEASIQVRSRLLSAPDTTVAQNLWIGLPYDSLVTSYGEFRDMIERLKMAEDLRNKITPGSPVGIRKVVELGAGYARLGHLIGSLPSLDWEYLGYELVPERVAAAEITLSRQNYRKIRLVTADLASPSFSPEPADVYFVYDYGSRPALDKTLNDLRLIARTHPLRVVGRGRSCRDAIEQGQPWLSQVNKPLHFSTYSIYES